MSRLANIQANFQAKQLEEKEHKLLSLLDQQQQRGKAKAGLNGVLPNKYTSSPRSTPSPTLSSSSSITLQPGKVRQMFEERRSKPNRGIDKSYPLEPLKTPPSSSQSMSNIGTSSRHGLGVGVGGVVPAALSNVGTSRKPPSPIITTKLKTSTSAPKLGPTSTTNKTPSRSSVRVAPISTGMTKSRSSEPRLDRSATYITRSSASSSISTSSSITSNHSSPTHTSSRFNKSDENGNDLVPPTTKYKDYREFEQTVLKKEAELGMKLKGLALVDKKAQQPSPPFSPVRKPVGVAGVRKPPVTPSSSRNAVKPNIAGRPPANKPPIKKSTPAPGTAPCNICGRCFATDRLEKHESICKKTKSKKRKVFDPTKMRMEGTEAEPYLRVVSAKKEREPPAKLKNQNWRKKHEEFIRTIRAAKEYNAHVAAGGDPNDLPPPPPSDTSDYIQCPHCNRKFSEGAATRHIPKCANIKSNKR